MIRILFLTGLSITSQSILSTACFVKISEIISKTVEATVVLGAPDPVLLSLVALVILFFIANIVVAIIVFDWIVYSIALEDNIRSLKILQEEY